MMIWEPKQSNEHFKKKEEQLKILVKRQSRFLETGQALSTISTNFANSRNHFRSSSLQNNL